MHMESSFGGGTFTSAHLSSTGSEKGNARRTTESHPADASQIQSRVNSILADNKELRAELDSLRAERNRLAEIVDRLTEVLGSKSADRLVHDVRNVLNERELYRALADSAM